jgi:uncharacterized membrane protein
VRRPVRLPRFDPEAFGRWSEAIARYVGTAKFIVYMTIFIVVWFVWNTLAPVRYQFDPYTFTFLTLVLSLQASYAAPLILLAQNRQADRDRLALEEDRRRATMQKADTEYLSREIASIRIALGEVATRDFLRSELNRLVEDLGEAAERRSKQERKEQRRIARRQADLVERAGRPAASVAGQPWEPLDLTLPHDTLRAAARHESLFRGTLRLPLAVPSPDTPDLVTDTPLGAEPVSDAPGRKTNGRAKRTPPPAPEDAPDTRSDDSEDDRGVGPSSNGSQGQAPPTSSRSKKQRRAPQGARRATPTP